MSNLCRCGAALIGNAEGMLVCAECGFPRSGCQCRRLVRRWDPSQEEMDELEHEIQHGSMADLAEIAERLEVPSAWLRAAMRDADWSDEAIDDVVAEACGWDRRIDDEQRHDRNDSPTWAPRRVEMTSQRNKSKSTEAEAPSVDEKGQPLAAQRPPSPPPTPQNQAPPRAIIHGIPIYNPAAANLVAKVFKDLGDGKLDMSKPESRMEVVMWTDLILKQEQIYGQTGFILRNLCSRANFAGFLARVVGRAAGRTQAGEPAGDPVQLEI